MKVLTLGQYHDFNACLYDTETGWFKYIKDERISGIKHSGKFHSIVDVIKKEKFAYEHIVFCFGDFFGDDLYDDNVTHYRTKLSECHETLKKYSAHLTPSDSVWCGFSCVFGGFSLPQWPYARARRGLGRAHVCLGVGSPVFLVGFPFQN